MFQNPGKASSSMLEEEITHCRLTVIKTRISKRKPVGRNKLYQFTGIDEFWKLKCSERKKQRYHRIIEYGRLKRKLGDHLIQSYTTNDYFSLSKIAQGLFYWDLDVSTSGYVFGNHVYAQPLLVLDCLHCEIFQYLPRSVGPLLYIFIASCFSTSHIWEENALSYYTWSF